MWPVERFFVTRKAVPSRKLFLKILIPQSELFPKSWTGKKSPRRIEIAIFGGILYNKKKRKDSS